MCGTYFLSYSTGQGKTALCLAIAAQRALLGEAVIILNASVELTFRDYKKALSMQSEIDIPLSLAADAWNGRVAPGCVIFASTQAFNDSPLATDFLEQSRGALIIDEFDSCIFTCEDSVSHCLESIKRSCLTLAFSGSDLLSHHIHFL
jgi:hypothetical protein